eukprot:698588_1
MLVFVLVAILILTATAALHYNRHFRLRLRSCYTVETHNTSTRNLPSAPPSLQNVRTRSASLQNIMHVRRQCCYVWKGVDDQIFDFFPVSFLFYILLLIFLCILICIIEILTYLQSDSEETLTDLLFALSIKSNHAHSLFELHKIHLLEDEAPAIYVLNLFLICGIMLVSCWESLFSFYRYYTTYQAIKTRPISSCRVIKRFLFYGIIYCTVFVVEIVVYYYTFLLVVLLHLCFNVYCTWKFAGFLIEEYKRFISVEEVQNDVISGQKNQQILHSVIFMKWTSMLCCVLQSISLSLFVILYNPTIIYFLPILWSISCSIFALNFARNRMFIRRKMFRIRQGCKYKCLCCKYKQKRRNTPLSEIVRNMKPTVDDSHNTNDIKESILDGKEPGQLPPRTLVLAVPKNTENDDVLHVDTIAISVASAPTDEKHQSPTYSRSRAVEYSYSMTNRPKRTKKALALLGIHETKATQSAMEVQLGKIDVLAQQTSISKSEQDKYNKPITPMVVDNDVELNLDGITEPYDATSSEPDLEAQETDVHPRQSHVQGTVSDVHELKEGSMKSFKLFAKYGFLSTANINSATQLKQYHHSTQPMSTAAADVFYTYISERTNKMNLAPNDNVSDLNKLSKSQSLPKRNSTNIYK